MKETNIVVFPSTLDGETKLLAFRPQDILYLEQCRHERPLNMDTAETEEVESCCVLLMCGKHFHVDAEFMDVLQHWQIATSGSYVDVRSISVVQAADAEEDRG